jgi:hypothetical protein
LGSGGEGFGWVFGESGIFLNYFGGGTILLLMLVNLGRKILTWGYMEVSFSGGSSGINSFNGKERNDPMFERISYTWQIMGASWDVLRRDKGLVLFPLFSCICCLIVFASFCVPLYSFQRAHDPIFYVVLFGFYFANYFVITFFNTGIVACAVSRMAGGDPTIMGGMREAFTRIHLIAGWALVSATVGLLLRLVAERSGVIGKIITAIIGGAWTVVTYLVVPVLVVENKGPIEAFKESTRLLTKTWGTRLAGSFGFGLMFFLLMLPGFLLLVAAMFAVSSFHSPYLFLVVIGCWVVYVMLLALVQSALQSIFQAAVYMFAQGALLSPSQAPGGHGFPVELVRNAMYEK